MMMRTANRARGGFIWALLDDGIKRPDTGEIDVARQRGARRHRRPVSPARRQLLRHQGNLVADPGRRARPTTSSRWKIISTSPTRASANSPGNCGNFASPRRKRVRVHRSARTALSISPAIPPGGKRHAWNQSAPAAAKNADALALRVDDPAGRELWTWVWPLRPERFLPAHAGTGRASRRAGGNQRRHQQSPPAN